MKSINTLWDILGENAVVFPKYPELADGNKHFEYDADPSIPDHIIQAEMQRSFALSKDVQFLMEKGSMDPNLESYYNDIFSWNFKKENLLEYSKGEFIHVINEYVKNKTLSVLHPYDAIESEKYQSDPELVSWLNDKHNLEEISEYAPKTYSDSLKYSDIENISLFPSVLKSGVSSSGDGVEVLFNKWDLQSALEKFWNYESIKNGTEPLLLQEYVEAVENVSVQMSVNSDGTISYIWMTDQITEWDHGEYYLGNVIDNTGTVDQKMIEIGTEIAEFAKVKGYIWTMGIDVLKDSAGNYFVIDGNFRLTGCTTPTLLKNSQFSHFDKIYATSYGAENASVFDVLKSVHSDAATILSSVTSHSGDITKGHIVIGWESVDHIKEKMQQINATTALNIELND